MRTSTAARTLLVTGLLAGTAALLASGAAYAGVRQAGPTKIVGTIDNKFDPADASATTDASGNVTIEFLAHGAHTIQSDEVKGFDSGAVSDGQTKTVTFAAKPGTYAFYCLYHKGLGMTGTLTVTAGAGGKPSATASATPSAVATPTASASATSGGVGAGAPTAPPSGTGAPGLAGNDTLKQLDSERAAVHGAVSGFRFFTMVGVAFVVLLCAAVLFSTRPRRAGR